MSLSADLEKATLTVALDLRHPLAYLALGPARAFAARRALALNWLPLAVPPLKPPSSAASDDDRGVRHRRHRAHAIAREIEVYAAGQGLVVRDPYRNTDAQCAHAAWLWVRERSQDALEPFLESLFRAYWAEGLDPSDVSALARLVEASGADGEGFRRWSESQGSAVAEALASELQAFGLFQVPAFVVEDEVFYGRQHLPMIEWTLDGREGPIPI